MKRSEAWHWIVTVLAVIGLFYHASRCSEIERGQATMLTRVYDAELEAQELRAQMAALRDKVPDLKLPPKIQPFVSGEPVFKLSRWNEILDAINVLLEDLHSRQSTPAVGWNYDPCSVVHNAAGICSPIPRSTISFGTIECTSDAATVILKCARCGAHSP